MTTDTELPKPKWASVITTPAANSKPKSIMLYGLPGTRKTSIAASIALVPGFDKVLFLDIDQGTEVLAQNPLLRNVEVLSLNPLEANSKAKLDQVIDDITSTDYGYDAVILDTLDVAQDVAEKFLKATATDTKNTFKVYGDLGIWTDEIVRKLHTSPNFTAIITAHSSETKTESGSFRTLPRLSGSSKDAIGGIPSIVAYLEYGVHPDTGEKHLLGKFGESDSHITKNRYGLPPVIVDPDMPKIYSIITERTGKPAVAETTK